MNIILAAIESLESELGMTIARLKAADMNFAAILLETPDSCPYLREGGAVEMLFKETEVPIAKNLSGNISLRNRNRGVIENIFFGGLLCEISINAGGLEICSIITAESAKNLCLREGDEIEWFIKANEVSLRALA